MKTKVILLLFFMFIWPKSISAESTGVENQLKDLYEKYGDIVNVVFCSIPETSKIVLEVIKEDESVNLLYSPAHLKEYLKKNNNLIRHAVIKNLKKHNNHMKIIQKIESWCLINRNISDLLRYDNMSEELIFAAFYATPQTKSLFKHIIENRKIKNRDNILPLDISATLSTSEQNGIYYNVLNLLSEMDFAKQLVFYSAFYLNLEQQLRQLDK